MSRIQGDVEARLWLDATGAVTKVCILRGPAAFDESVFEALSSWQYEPARFTDGTPVRSLLRVVLPFRLQ